MTEDTATALKAAFANLDKNAREALLRELHLPPEMTDDGIFAAALIALRDGRGQRYYPMPWIVPCQRPHSDEAKPYWPNQPYTPIWRIPLGNEQIFYGTCQSGN